MSASPTIAVSSTKRPLEEPSSPAGANDQPDAKRPALDKILRDEPEDIDIAEPVKAESIAAEDIKVDDEKPDLIDELAVANQNGAQDAQSDTVIPDAPSANSILSQSSLHLAPMAALYRTSNTQTRQTGFISAQSLAQARLRPSLAREARTLPSFDACQARSALSATMLGVLLSAS